jgi:nucleoside-diphosphate-sugar epimerase
MVRMTGLASREEVTEKLARARVYVVTSVLETVGLTVLEAMGVGVPVVASYASCLPEVREDAVVYCDPATPTTRPLRAATRRCMASPSKILITGATGFTGEFILQEFLRHRDRHLLSILVRSEEKAKQKGYDSLPVQIQYGDIADSEALCRSLAGVSTLIDTVPLSLGHTSNIIAACRESGTRRLIALGNMSIFTTLDDETRSVILAAEDSIRRSGLDYTIIRPTMIFGTANDRNMSRMIEFIRRFPVIPILGPGKYLHQPVYVADVARAVFQALASPNAVNKAYNIAGRAPLTFNATIDTISNLLGRRVARIHVPYWFCYAVFLVIEKLPLLSSIRLEQVQRLNQDKAFSYEQAANDFGFAPLDFETAIKYEIEGLVRRGMAAPISDPS